MHGLILAIDRGKFNSVCCWCDMARGRRVARVCREKNCLGADVARRVLNHSKLINKAVSVLARALVSMAFDNLVAERLKAFPTRLRGII